MIYSPIQDKHIVLGITGSIACYKAADLSSKLAQAGALVDCVLTDAATKFITPITFQSLTGRRAFINADLWGSDGHVLHIELGKHADMILIAPATANTLAKLANGIADNLLTIAALAADCPVLIAPAMDGGMFSHPATQENLDRLRRRGVQVIGPGEGHLASGMVGKGRMLEPLDIFGHVRLILAQGGPLAGRKVVVTAGGTREPIDPVRAITNRSSGKQGYALAQAALDLGAEVTLISGSVCLEAPVGAEQVDVNSVHEMLDAVLEEIPKADILIMAAAVTDFRPTSPAAEKIKKDTGVPRIQLEAAPDILVEVAHYKERNGWPQVSVGFAAESQDLIENARVKLENKKLDMIVANDISDNQAGFSVDTNRVTIIYPDGHTESLPLMSKVEVASEILERVRQLILVDK
ncbi:MAG: bifunctional phosphopantothenoylcysteine decarboxylase/phosphopantothenate--cysteine ligase CoaBC [Chloroflexota bacterium]|nr:bifunctional phosphopantothenoylcysteine decarboxylase/phosphopantothenate--cysteine ligase CoaBC [Chloroflexota bacterium]